VALRYRGTPLDCVVDVHEDTATLELAEPALVAPGQAAVLYDGDEVLGGGIVDGPLGTRGQGPPSA
jgi:tRNA U34 2-thiouridine synthase MnmA/TrmU